MDSPPLVIEARFGDMGAFSESSEWDLDFRQLDQGPICIDLKVMSRPYLRLMNVKMDKRIHQRGVAPSDQLSFGFPIGGSLDWHGSDTSHAAMMSFNRQSGFDTVSTQGFEATTLSVSATFMESMASDLGLSIPDNIYLSQSGGVFKHSHATHSARDLLDRIIAKETVLFDRESETELITALLNIHMDPSDYSDISTMPVRSRTLSRAIDYIEDNRFDAISVVEVCKGISTSIRTLDRAFKERFAISPKTYIKRRRLAGVNLELLARSETHAVSDVANEWGFWHMGQFAKDYTEQFGELPSETLRRRKSFRI